MNPSSVFSILRQRVSAELFRKILWGLGLAIVCGTVYFGVQRFHLGTPIIQDPCPISELLPFDTRWTHLYLSMFILVGVSWMLLPSRRTMIHFATVMLCMEAIAWLFFFFMPTSCPRPPAPDAIPIYQITIALDDPINCFPCLHSALTLLAAVGLFRCFPREIPKPVRRAMSVLLVLWCVIILISILILRQHSAFDLAAGLVLGGIAARRFVVLENKSLKAESHADNRS